MTSKEYINERIEEEKEDINKWLEQGVLTDLHESSPANQELKVLKQIKDYLEVLEILKPYIIVEYLNGCYWLRIGGNGYDKYFVYEITKEQYELLKEWLKK